MCTDRKKIEEAMDANQDLEVRWSTAYDKQLARKLPLLMV